MLRVSFVDLHILCTQCLCKHMFAYSAMYTNLQKCYFAFLEGMNILI